MLKLYKNLYEGALIQSSERTVKFMCEKLNELKGVSAEEILEKSEQMQTVPVDMDKVIETLGLFKEARDFSDIEGIEGRKISGLVLVKDDDVKIYYNVNDELIKKRYTAAHEIAHCCLHGDRVKDDYIEFSDNDNFRNKHEKEASAFASRLLVPEKSLKLVYDVLLKPTLKDLTNIFQVPEKIMKGRLKEEGLKVCGCEGIKSIKYKKKREKFLKT